MSKIHITLVGGQAAPIYNAIVAISPDKVVFICSDTKECRRSMEAVKHEIAVPGEAKFISPTNPREILSLARQLAKQYADEQVVLNISGGLKSWSHLFGIVFQAEPNATVVYMDQNNVLWNYKTMTGSQNFAFDMHTHFRLYGNSIENHYKRLDDYTEKDDQAVKIIENVRGFNIIAFNDLLSLLTKKNQNILQNNKSGRFEHSSGSYVEWRKRQGEQDELVSICLYNKKGVCLQKEIESPNAVELAFIVVGSNTRSRGCSANGREPRKFASIAVSRSVKMWIKMKWISWLIQAQRSCLSNVKRKSRTIRISTSSVVSSRDMEEWAARGFL